MSQKLLIYSSNLRIKLLLSLDPKNELGVRARAYEQLRTLESELELKKIYMEKIAN